MNINHLTYAVTVAEAGSLSKAAEKLLVAPSNLSRAIKELEKDLKIRIFDRSGKGMKLTPQGEELLQNARTLLSQIDELNSFYRDRSTPPQSFSVSVPRAGYIAAAFSEFYQRPECSGAKILYTESNSYGAIDNVMNRRCDLGIVRSATKYDKHFIPLFEKNGIDHKVISQFRYVALTSVHSPLAQLSQVCHSDLSSLTEVAYADPYVPSLPIDTVRQNEQTATSRKRIFMLERSDSLGLLRMNRNSYMWVSPMPKKQLEFYRLCQKSCPDNTRSYSDVLIYRRNYKMSRLDEMFVEEIYKSAKECGLE